MVNRYELISRQGWERLDEERLRLLKVERPKVVQNVADAAAEGDRSENAEYIYGKKKLREIDRRLKYLGNRLDRLKRTDPPIHSRFVQFLSVVEMENIETEEHLTYMMVGPDESQPEEGKLSYLSPIGKALMGSEVDQDIEVSTPGGMKYFAILKIHSSSDSNFVLSKL